MRCFPSNSSPSRLFHDLLDHFEKTTKYNVTPVAEVTNLDDQLFDTPLRDNHGRIVVGIIGVSTALTDKLSL